MESSGAFGSPAAISEQRRAFPVKVRPIISWKNGLYSHADAHSPTSVTAGSVAGHQGDDERLRPNDEETGMSATPETCFYLTVAIVGEIHAEAIARFGGADGVRDLTLLESAVAAPQAGQGGKSVYADLVEIAAAYLFYLCRNDPFVDGNKRTALGACIVFLRLNGIEPKPDSRQWGELTLAVAGGVVDRDETTKRLRALVARPRSAPPRNR